MADDFLSSILAQLTAPVDGGGQNAPAPVQPPMAPAPQPQSDLDAKIATGKAVQAEPTPAPVLSQPTSFTPSMPLPQELQGTSPTQQAAIQQQRQQAEGEKEAAANPLRSRPVLFDLLSSLSGKNIGGPNVPGYQGPSRTAHFENFLGNFLTALSAGLAGEGRGPGAGLRGAGIAMQAPREQALQNYQIGQQQQQQQAALDIERQKAQALVPNIRVSGPNGEDLMISSSQIPQYMMAGYKLAGAKAQAQAHVQGTQITAEAKRQGDILKADVESGKVRLSPAIDPSTGQPGMGKYDPQGNFLGMADASVVAALLPKTVSNVQTQPGAGGGQVVTGVNTTTTAPQLPARGAGNSQPSAIQNIKAGKGPQGNQPSSPSAPPVQQPQKKSGTGALPQRVQQAAGLVDPFGYQIGKTSDGMQLTRKEVDSNQSKFNKDYVEPVQKTEGTFKQFQSILDDVNDGKDLSGAASVVALFNAIGISATPLKGAGFRINNNVIEEHAEARGLGQSLYQKFLKLKSGDVITPQQIKDYAEVALQARHDQYVNAVQEAHRQGLSANFLPRATGQNEVIDAATAKIYLDSAGGDRDKAAKAIMAAGYK